MTPPLRKLGLTFHIVVSVAWIGALAAFLALALVALGSDLAASRAAYLSMDVIGRAVLLPLSVGAVVSGIVQSLTTKWGLFRYYWVIVKLALSVFATAALFVHQFSAVAAAARLASDANTAVLQGRHLQQLGAQLELDAGLGLMVLLTITIIAVYKPWGVVGYLRKSLKLFLAAIAALVVGFVALHLSGRSPHQHSH